MWFCQRPHHNRDNWQFQKLCWQPKCYTNLENVLWNIKQKIQSYIFPKGTNKIKFYNFWAQVTFWKWQVFFRLFEQPPFYSTNSAFFMTYTQSIRHHMLTRLQKLRCRLLQTLLQLPSSCRGWHAESSGTPCRLVWRWMRSRQGRWATYWRLILGGVRSCLLWNLNDMNEIVSTISFASLNVTLWHVYRMLWLFSQFPKPIWVP